MPKYRIIKDDGLNYDSFGSMGWTTQSWIGQIVNGCESSLVKGCIIIDKPFNLPGTYHADSSNFELIQEDKVRKALSDLLSVNFNLCWCCYEDDYGEKAPKTNPVNSFGYHIYGDVCEWCNARIVLKETESNPLENPK